MDPCKNNPKNDCTRNIFPAISRTRLVTIIEKYFTLTLTPCDTSLLKLVCGLNFFIMNTVYSGIMVTVRFFHKSKNIKSKCGKHSYLYIRPS